MERAVAAPLFHHQWPPGGEGDVIWVERSLGDEAEAGLRAMGYEIERRGALGDIQAIELSPSGPIPVSDPRGIGVGLAE